MFIVPKLYVSSPYESPVLRYGIGLSSAAILVIFALYFFEGTARLIVLGMAVIEAVLIPQFLKMAANESVQ